MLFLEAQLRNEKDLYARRISSGRTDLLATMLIRRTELEIQRLERRIKNDKRKNEPARKHTSGFICSLKRAIGRNWAYFNGYYYSVLTVFTSSKSREKAGSK